MLKALVIKYLASPTFLDWQTICKLTHIEEVTPYPIQPCAEQIVNTWDNSPSWSRQTTCQQKEKALIKVKESPSIAQININLQALYNLLTPHLEHLGSEPKLFSRKKLNELLELP